MKNVCIFSCLILISLSTYSFILPKKTEVYPLTKIEKNWGMVKADLFASKFETTNKEYQVFLNSIKAKSTPEKWERIKVHVDNWNSAGEEIPNPIIDNYYQHPAYEDYPLVNISHEGAIAYCDWLTTIYNNRPKRKYKKVKFRLPTAAEWTIAASANHPKAPFPWGGYYTRNGKGWKLANFTTIPETAIKRNAKTGKIEVVEEDVIYQRGIINDFANLTAPVTAYFPNDFGLHQLSGNVAEMLAEPGRTKGGSWASTGYYIRIDAEDEYAGITEPDPRIGFRYFVDIIEE